MPTIKTFRAGQAMLAYTGADILATIAVGRDQATRDAAADKEALHAQGASQRPTKRTGDMRGKAIASA